jgi:hypothetical protein
LTVKTLHVYCVVECRMDGDLELRGVGGGPVYAVSYRDLAAAVSPSPEKYDIVGDMKAHEIVVERLFNKYPIVPFRFGQHAMSREEVKGFLVENYTLLKALLSKLRGRVELNLKLFWNMERVLSRLADENLTIRVLAKQMVQLSGEKAYSVKLRLGQLVERKLKELRERIVTEAYSLLKPLSVDFKENQLITNEMVWNAAFLVDASAEAEFDRAVEKLHEKYGEILTFKYLRSPPYTFSTVNIGGLKVNARPSSPAV